MKYPWMPLFWGDFLANTMHLSAQEAGAYLFLIAHAWEHKGEIPTEPVRLARIAHVRQDQWKRVWKALENFFETEAHGPLMSRTTHHRVTAELQRLGKISSKRKAAAQQKQSKSSANGQQTGVHPRSIKKEEKKTPTGFSSPSLGENQRDKSARASLGATRAVAPSPRPKPPPLESDQVTWEQAEKLRNGRWENGGE